MEQGDELLRVHGIGSEYRELLRAAGVHSILDLRDHSADHLTGALAEANDRAIKKTRRRIVRRVPARAQVERWIEHASVLDLT